MHHLPLIATCCFLLSLIFGIIGLAGGNNGLSRIYTMGFNTTTLGKDLIADTTVFNFNNSNPIYSTITTLSSGDSEQPSQPAKAMQAGDPEDWITADLVGVLNSVASSLDMDKSGTMYNMINNLIVTISTDVQKELGAVIPRIGNIVLADASKILADVLSKMAAEFTAAAGPPPGETAPQSPQKRDVSFQDLSRSLDQALNEAILPRMTALDSANVNLVSRDPQYLASFGSALTNPDSTNPLIVLLRSQGEAVSGALRKVVNDGMNSNVKTVREALGIRDWYRVYQTRFCWGSYADGKEVFEGCSTTRNFRDADLASIIQKLLDAYGIQASAPPSVPLGDNVNDALLGLRRIFGSLSWTYIGFFILDGLSFLVSILGTVTHEKKLDKIAPLILPTVASTALFLCNEFYGDLLLTLGTNWLTPGLVGLLNVTYHPGFGYIAILFFHMSFAMSGATTWGLIFYRRSIAAATKAGRKAAKKNFEKNLEKSNEEV